MAKKLETYLNKRDFTKTAEPRGGKSFAGGRKFAVQFHRARRDHYDFRLEWKGVLLSWAVPKGPSFDPKDKRLAVRVEDHPVEYADFEGNIPKGEYGGGAVMLWDEGEWAPVGDFAAGLESGSVKFILFGKRMKGGWALVRMKDGKNWLLIKEKDEYARAAGAETYAESVKSGRTVEEIARGVSENPFRHTEVQLAELVKTPPEGKEWLFEVKYDGYRIVAFSDRNGVRLDSRNGLDFTEKFPAVARAMAEFAKGRAFVLDGEMVVADENGRTDFQKLQRYVKSGRGGPAVYMAFDLLAIDGRDIRNLPLTERKEKLSALLENAPENICFGKHVEGEGAACFRAAEKLGFEGIVGKRKDSAYRGGRGGDWVKIKCRKRAEFAVCGFTVKEREKEGIGALLLGAKEGGKLRYCGKAGTGMSAAEKRALRAAFQKIVRKTPPFADPPDAKRGEKIFWISPKFAAEVEYAEMTDENLLRQASFLGIRADKNGKEVSLERARDGNEDEEKKVCGVSISSPERKIYRRPPIAKIDVARYYAAVAARMLPVAGGRLLSEVRCHDGVNRCFFKRHPAGESEGVKTRAVSGGEGEELYFYVESAEGLIAEVQQGAVEFHIWGSRAEDPEKPDLMVFDLDPDEKLPLAAVRRGVKDLKKILDGLSLRSFLKTSGGKGYHVVVPFPAENWETFRDFAKNVANLMAEKWPNRYTANIRKSERKGKIFIDWERNGRGATSVAPYSLRARLGAKVSMPIAWKELDTVPPDGVDLANALERLKKPDPWKKLFER